MAYCWTGSHSRVATSTGATTGPGRSCRTSGLAPGWSVATAPGDRAHRLASPPTTTATSELPSRMAAQASLIRVCWGIPSSTRWVRAVGAPTAMATSRPGSG